MTRDQFVASLEKELNSFEVRYAASDFRRADELASLFDGGRETEFASQIETLAVVVEKLVDCKYEEILQLTFQEFAGTSAVSLEEMTRLRPPREDPATPRLVLFVGVALLQEFVRLNWTGPFDGPAEYAVVRQLLSGQDAHRVLCEGGEPLHALAARPELLGLASVLLRAAPTGVCSSRDWWLMRALAVHQALLHERSPRLHREMAALAERLTRAPWLVTTTAIGAQLFVEVAHMHLSHHEVAPARCLVEHARKEVDLGIELDGALGKRTLFQQTAKAQLYVKLNRTTPDGLPQSSSNNDAGFPCDCRLQDDTLLDRIAFIDGEGHQVQDLLPEEQIVLLAHCHVLRRSNASDDLLREQTMAYVGALLSQPRVWAVYVSSLILRCREERSSRRHVERAMAQMQALVDGTKQSTVPLCLRLRFFYAAMFVPRWMLEKELADILLSLGAVKSALEIYERLLLWEDAITCYRSLGRGGCAERVVRDQLSKGETPMLWCLLGDVTEDPQHYQTAWELSQQRSARAQRALGLHHFKRRDYEKSIPCFTCSLDVDPSQPSLWFSLGYAATQMGDNELAARSYRQVVTLDPDNFEAWNNLANAYITTKQKMRAWRSLREALKCNYEDWRVWENFMLVSIDVGAFEDVIQSHHRLIDLKGKHSDVEVLSVLVRAIVENLPDVQGHPASRLRKKTLELLGRITSQIPNEFKLWELYSLLVSSESGSKDTLERAVQYQQKAVRCAVQQRDWEKSSLSCLENVKSAQRLAQLSETFVKLLEDEAAREQQKVSLRLMLQNVAIRVERILPNMQATDQQELTNLLKSLKNNLENVANL